MKKTLFDKIKDKLYFIAHPKFKDTFAKRFSDDFTQDDLQYCVSHLYKLKLKKKIDFNNVRTFNEKLNWLKVFYHDDKMTECADKVTAPAYFITHTGYDQNYIVKNIGIYDNANDIDFDNLPRQFVLKSNWGSGKQIIITDKSKFDFELIKKEISLWNEKKSNHYYDGFEYGYKNIIPKIVCEEFINFEYKIEFFCFDGKTIYFWTVFNDKTDNVCANFYDAYTLEQIKMRHGYPNSEVSIEVPKDYREMFKIAENLSKGFPFVRVDFFKTKESFKFSEMTFYHWSGFKPFEPEEMDYKFGEKLVLPSKKI